MARTNGIKTDIEWIKRTLEKMDAKLDILTVNQATLKQKLDDHINDKAIHGNNTKLISKLTAVIATLVTAIVSVIFKYFG